MINTKAATITGAILGALCAVFAGAFVGMMGAPYAGVAMMGGAYAAWGWISIVYGLVVGAIGGALIALVYNWALSMK